MLGVKIGNDPAARPQSGLNAADMVYEVQAEGGVTRYIALFQCGSAPSLGPVRSSRWVDVQVMHQFGHPILAFAGGIIPDTTLIANSRFLYGANLLSTSAQAATRISTRVPPENLYTSTSALWSEFPSQNPIPPYFSFSTSVPSGGKATASAHIPFSATSDIYWTWSASAGRWLRSYGSTPDMGASGVQHSAANVVIEHVHTVPGKYSENGVGHFGVHSLIVGSGPVTVLRNGQAFSGTWKRSSASAPTRLVNSSGATIPLTPGQTWVEVVPAHDRVTLSSS